MATTTLHPIIFDIQENCGPMKVMNITLENEEKATRFKKCLFLIFGYSTSKIKAGTGFTQDPNVISIGFSSEDESEVMKVIESLRPHF